MNVVSKPFGSSPVTELQDSQPSDLAYEKNAQAIYEQSFATVQKEADLARFDGPTQSVVTRLIHACGMIEIAERVQTSARAVQAGRDALNAGAPILCDCEMVKAGIIARALPAANDVLVTLNDPRTRPLANALNTTRSAAAIDLWAPYVEGAVVAIGNAPTALFRLLELMDQGLPKPAVIVGFPVGFVGAAESKAELARYPRGAEFLTLQGRQGGSALASAAVNGLTVGLDTTP